MFFKFLKKQTLTLILLTIFIIPQTIYAYTDYLIAGGETVGIRLNTNGILIVGSYEINGHNTLIESGLQPGDIIDQINNKDVDTINQMIDIIDDCNCDSLDIDYFRNSKEKHTKLDLYFDDGTLKTGLYVKDRVSGIGTLSFIVPETKEFCILGHEIANESTGEVIDITDGVIFDSKVTSITRSSEGRPGSKNAILYSDTIYGKILKNTNKGIFGKYTSNITSNKLYKVATINDINLGEAKILTVIDNDKVEGFKINILSIKQTTDKLKNIEFEITDKKLLNISNGIVQGMSGSPIIQNNKIIGAVTHVVVENPHKGYGILIENMLEELEN